MEKIKTYFNNQILNIFLRDGVDKSVFAEIFKLREYRVVEDIIKTAQNPIVDVGAHSGLFTLYCRAFNQKVAIFAIEPEPENCKLLKEHIKVNKLQQIKIIQAALSKESKDRYLHISKDNHNHYLLKDAQESLSELKIKTFSLIDLCKKNKIEKISLIKLDIEGGEYEVFDSLDKNIITKIDTFIMEYHNQGKNTYRIIEQKLRECGFGVQIFPSQFDRNMGFLFANNKRIKA